MDEICEFLKSNGPQLSTAVAEYLCSYHGISPVAARQRISRTKGSINRLSMLRFPRKARFLYLEEQFASPWYWQNLEAVLRENTTAYGFALSALLARDGLCLERYFPIICGAPDKQKRHLSASAVLEGLLEAGLVVRVPSGGLSLISIRRNEQATHQKIPNFRARLTVENLLIDSVSTWLKNLNLVSYYSIRTRNDEKLPQVGTYNWDLSAPSYLNPMLKRSKKGEFVQGFWVCDVYLGGKLSVNAANTFLKKCRNSRAVRNLPRSMQMIVSYHYSKEAFLLLKENGVIPATVRNLFGRETEKALKKLVSALEPAYQSSLDAEQLDKVLDKLNRLSSDFGSLKGTLFELLVRDVKARNVPGVDFIEVNHISKLGGLEAETDVVVYSKGRGVWFIEAKAYNSSHPLPDKQVDRWLDHNIPTVAKFSRQQSAWKNENLTFEIWSTAPLSKDSIARIEEAGNKNVRRYSIIVKQADEIRNEFKNTRNKGLLNILEKYFLKKR